MTVTEQEAVQQIPHQPPAIPVLKKMRWPFPLIWLVPLIAALATTYYIRDLLHNRGPEITIRFDDANGIRVSETHLVVHGVHVGTVTAIELSGDKGQALVHVRLREDAASIARIGTQFWMVSPDLSGGEFRGLSTFVSGPYIEALPGNGPQATDFAGQANPPVMVAPGTRVILYATRLDKLQVDSPVFFRGVQVGAVQDLRLSSDATQVTTTVFIYERYAALVHKDSKFWIIKGADISGGLFGGLNLKLDSLRTLLVGGVSFATPDNSDKTPAGEGSTFQLYDEADKDWLEWSPKIDLSPGKPTLEDPSRPKAESPKKMMESAK